MAVRNLFYNVPARRNFLKTPATELKHLTERVQSQALANPETGFRLEHDGHEHYDLPAATADDWHTATRRRITGLFGEEHEDELVRVSDASSDLTVRGFVGAPSFHRKTRGQQFLFVNDRAVTDRYLSHAVKKAYDELLPDGAFPFFALFLSMDPRRVDVNVHPQKEEVKFDDQSGIYAFLRNAVRGALGRVHVAPQFEGEDDEPTDASADRSSTGDESAASRSRPTSFQPRSSSGESDADPVSRRESSRHSGRSGTETPPGEQSEALYRPPGRSSDEENGSGTRSGREERETETGPSTSSQTGEERRPVWGLHDTYVMTPTETGLMIVDQRAAHVRVLYERALTRLQEQRGESQRLLFPHTVELGPAELELIEELRDDLEALGFELERLSGRTLSVRGVPTDAPGGAERELLEELLEQYTSAQDEVDDGRRKHLAKTLALQTAVERGQSLSETERRALLNDLFECEMPYADPTGTPTIVKLSLEELADRFGR